MRGCVGWMECTAARPRITPIYFIFRYETRYHITSVLYLGCVLCPLHGCEEWKHPLSPAEIQKWPATAVISRFRSAPQPPSFRHSESWQNVLMRHTLVPVYAFEAVTGYLQWARIDVSPTTL